MSTKQRNSSIMKGSRWLNSTITSNHSTQKPQAASTISTSKKALKSCESNTHTLHWQDLTWRQTLQSIPRFYGQCLQTYFNHTPAAQTLFVTMVLGALGALTLNVLRMSKVGWWSLQDDPPWGEIVVGPLLGALAAFGIFLVGSSGLLLTSDSSGAQPLSAYFIGLLCFISGLLHDAALGRAR